MHSVSSTFTDHIREEMGRRTTILLLEDDPEFCGLLDQLLDPARFEITRVGNGVDGLKKVKEADFDLILCDMMMPSLPGDMFFLAVERIKPHLCKRFIFMTGHRADPKWDAFARKVGGLMLWKPFHFQDLMDGINSVLKKAKK